MKRRQFITPIGGITAASPLAGLAWQPMPVTGFLTTRADDDSTLLAAVRRRCCRSLRALAGLLLGLLQGATVSAAELTPLKVGISEPVNTVLAIWMADAAGFY